MRRVKVIMADQKALIVGEMLRGGARNQRLRRHALGLGLDHDRCAVCVLGADIEAIVAAHLQEAHPDVGLYGLDDVAEV